MKFITTILILIGTINTNSLLAEKITGSVKDTNNHPLAFASIYIKGTTKGTTSNDKGEFMLELEKGMYTLICRYVGFEKMETTIEISDKPIRKDFILKQSGKELKQIRILAGEDRALEVIKNAIKKRKFYNKQIDAFKANAYIKGNFKLNEITSNKALLNLMGVSGKDSTSRKEKRELEESKGILFLSESYNEIAYKRPDTWKVTVKSSRVSGNSSSYGFSQPMFINLYDNNVDFGKQLSPRGFISPIAETALLSYKYALLDIYQEDGKTINIIQVIPRHKYEPLFSGILHIIQDEWRIHNVDLFVDKDHQLEVLDTIKIKQVFIPVNNVLMVKDQSFAIQLNLFGFNVSGSFVNVFTDYVFDYDTKKTFNKYQMEYEDDALKKTSAFWDNARPVPLDAEEIADFKKKDSIEKEKKNKKDSIVLEKNSLKKILLKGYSSTLKAGQTFRTTPLLSLQTFQWNTAEGINIRYGANFTNRINKDKFFTLGSLVRYGISNQQFNAKVFGRYHTGKTNKKDFRFSLGRYVFQYNNTDPVQEILNSFYTLFYGRNYMKFYQAYYAKAQFEYKLVEGISFVGGMQYQDRQPLRNTNLHHFSKENSFTENYPTEKINTIEPRHQAFITKLGISYQPGRKYIKYPDRVEATRSHYPIFSAVFINGLKFLQSDVNYATWRLMIEDDMDAKRWGTFAYNASVGGFLNREKVFVADLQHFNGNQIILASPYLQSFQLSPYYVNSNAEKFYTTIHAEHHFYGLLTNKIPLFRKLKWYLVGGTNAYYVTNDNNYVEASIGLENIGFKLFRFLRVDAIAGYTNFKNPVYGIRLGLHSPWMQVDNNQQDVW